LEKLQENLISVCGIGVPQQSNTCATTNLTPAQQQSNTCFSSTTRKMPRKSKKQRFILELQGLVKNRLFRRAMRSVDDEEDSVEDAVDIALTIGLAKSKRRRFLFRQTSYRKGENRFDADVEDEYEDKENEEEAINDEASQLPWLTEEEFLQKYRMSKESFSLLVDEVKDHPVFKSKSARRPQAPVSHQVMVFLKYVGTEGSGASCHNQRHTFHIGYGTSVSYRRRVTRAILSLRDKYYYWPDEEERQQLSIAVHEKFQFPHCVGIADGTLFPLFAEPQTEDAPDYSGRKYGYSLTTMIVCDYKKRIRYYLSGFPGSAHDNRVWKNTKLCKSPELYFGPQQYVVGDSAFENSATMVSAFKSTANCGMTEDNEMFNNRLARLRIISEHCIGILKGRFPWLRSIRQKITKDKNSIRRILQLIDATVILHNMLIEFGEDEKEDWIDFDDFSEIAMQSPYEENDELNHAIPLWAPKDTRRSQILAYFKEFFHL
jgi:DDE superfamily endonuclease